MNNVSRTLYIPLYGKSFVSRKGILLRDPKAEELWQAEGFALRGKAKSKWLAYWLGMRAAVFDRWTEKQLEDDPSSVVIHLGCGLDSRCHRVASERQLWLDVDFPEVIRERQKFFRRADGYRMIEGDLRDAEWVSSIPADCKAVVVMEGVSMYLKKEELFSLFTVLQKQCRSLSVLLDCYSEFAAKASRFRNPINEVGVSAVYGIADPMMLEKAGLTWTKEHEMTPQELINQLAQGERRLFQTLYGGRLAKKIYRLYEYRS